MLKVAAAVERLVQQYGKFNRKDVSHYLRDYKAEMLRCGISKGLQVLLFNRLSTDGLQGSIHEIRQQHPTWAAFEEALKLAYSIEDTSEATPWGFEDWVEAPKKGMKVLEVFTDFERHFGRLSARDQTILMLDKVAMFLRAVDFQDRHDLGIEYVTTESDLTEEWDGMRSNICRFTKRKKWPGNEEKKTPKSDPVHRAGVEH